MPGRQGPSGIHRDRGRRQLPQAAPHQQLQNQGVEDRRQAGEREVSAIQRVSWTKETDSVREREEKRERERERERER